jgi:hypothetical protein
VDGGRHSASDEHTLKHLPPLPQTYGEQDNVSGPIHCPAALHVGAGVYRLPVHDSFPQMVPIGQFAHPPWPSHLPLVPQDGWPRLRQTPRGSVVPAAMGVQ